MFYQMTRSPLIIGGAALGAGYAWSMIRGSQRPVSSELVEFTRREQMRRLKAFFVSKLVQRRPPQPA